MKNAVVIRHVAFEDLGSLEEVLIKAQYHITMLDAGLDDLTKINQAKTDLLIVLGGPIGVYDKIDYPFLVTEENLLKERIEQNRPTIGICLGAQLLASAMGGRVYPGGTKEIGWSPLVLTAMGEKSCFRHLKNKMMLHWHGDTFTLPEIFELYASTTVYENQGFMLGNHILGLQFHPEVLKKRMEQWFVGHAIELAVNNISIAKLREDFEKYADDLKVAAQKFFEEWTLGLGIEHQEKLIHRFVE